MAFVLATRAAQQVPTVRPAPRAAVAAAARPALARCAGACTCGGTCGKTPEAPDDALGHLLRSAVEDRASAPRAPGAILARLKYPGQTCSDERLDVLHTAMKLTCKQPFSCAKNLPCPELNARHAVAVQCHADRKGIEDECFGGNSDAGHKDQIRTVGNAVDTCANKIASKRC
ncbi:MAG TPA: hypothetical protein VGF63_11490 [Solirubrobacteraceae bacterium]|jgi:hypothetical protein